VYESTDVIRSALSTLHDRFRYDPAAASKPSRPGYVPLYLTVLEAQRNMVAHLHVVYAGERRLMDVHDLRRDWGDVIDAPASKPPQINLRPLSVRSDRWRVDRADAEAYGTFGTVTVTDFDSWRRWQKCRTGNYMTGPTACWRATAPTTTAT